jgi:hypothetical protein
MAGVVPVTSDGPVEKSVAVSAWLTGSLTDEEKVAAVGVGGGGLESSSLLAGMGKMDICVHDVAESIIEWMSAVDPVEQEVRAVKEEALREVETEEAVLTAGDVTGVAAGDVEVETVEQEVVTTEEAAVVTAEEEELRAAVRVIVPDEGAGVASVTVKVESQQEEAVIVVQGGLLIPSTSRPGVVEPATPEAPPSPQRPVSEAPAAPSSPRPVVQAAPPPSPLRPVEAPVGVVAVEE